MRITYQYLRLTEETTKRPTHSKILTSLLALSQTWAEEINSPAYTANRAEDFLNRDIFLAQEANQHILGYAMGDFKTHQEQTSYGQPGETAFILDELYVVPNHRQAGLGKSLYLFVEEEVREKADFIGLEAMSPRYQDLLSFYLEKLDFSFIYATLVKRLDT